MGRTKHTICKFLWLLCIGFISYSCTTDESSPAFNISSNNAETAIIEFSTASVSSPFYYRILAQEMIINWGDKTRPAEYVHFGNQNDWSSIRPVEHAYADSGSYVVNIRTNRPFMFDFSKSDSLPQNTITKLKLQTCYSLSELYCRNQPITQIDLTDCYNLSVLDIGSSSVSDLILGKESRLKTILIDSTQIIAFDLSLTPSVQHLAIGNVDSMQEIGNLNSLTDLRTLYVNGQISETDLDVSLNDSLQYFSATNANIERVDLRKLPLLDSISVIKCNQLEAIELEVNPKIRRITLIDNSRLSSDAINAIFRSLPQTDAYGRYIMLSGNAGDEACDRSIATRKGWIFE